MFFNSDFEFPRLVWYGLDGVLGEYVDLPYSPAWFAAIDQDSNIVACGLIRGEGAECRALARESRQTLWQLPLGEDGFVVNGAALVPGRLYVTTIDGVLYALGDGAAE